MKFFEIEYTQPDTKKEIWADDFRVGVDGLWVEFLGKGVITAYVPKDAILAINCRYEAGNPSDAALGEAIARRAGAPDQPASASQPINTGQPSAAPQQHPAGPVEASIRRPDQPARPTPVPA